MLGDEDRAGKFSDCSTSYVVESADGALGVCLCPQHLAENFPQWKKMRVGAVNCPRRPEKERIGASGKCSRERARYSIGRNLTGSSGTA